MTKAIPIDGAIKTFALGGTPTEEVEIVDIGPYCVECREDSTGQEKRTERTEPSVKITGQKEADGSPEVIAVLLKGWLCESCQPFENPLIEETYKALVERRCDPVEVKRKFRSIGMEEIWAKWHGPMLDDIQERLGLEEG